MDLDVFQLVESVCHGHWLNSWLFWSGFTRRMAVLQLVHPCDGGIFGDQTGGWFHAFRRFGGAGVILHGEMLLFKEAAPMVRMAPVLLCHLRPEVFHKHSQELANVTQREIAISFLANQVSFFLPTWTFSSVGPGSLAFLVYSRSLFLSLRRNHRWEAQSKLILFCPDFIIALLPSEAQNAF